MAVLSISGLQFVVVELLSHIHFFVAPWTGAHLASLSFTISQSWIKLVHSGFLSGSAGKESACNVGDLGLIPGLGRSLREGNSYPLQYSGLENSMDCIVRGVANSLTE